jgi:VanZ family protein
MISVALLDTVPWFLPGAVIAFALGLAACGPLGRVLGVGRVVAWLGIVSFGLIVVTTLTPQREALDLGAIGSGTCDFSRVTLAPLAFYAADNDAAENVFLFVPLGVAIALVPRSRRKAALVVGAVSLPFAIEAIQRQVVVFNRACQSADVVDNLAGLAIGLVVGGLLAYAGSFVARRRDAAGGG